MTPAVELVRADCPYCSAPQLYRRSQAGTLVICRANDTQFKLAKFAAFGRKQWDACRDLRLLRDALRLLKVSPSARKRRLVALAVARSVFDWCRNPWFREAQLIAADLAAAGDTARPLADTLTALAAMRAEPWREVALELVSAAPSGHLPLTDAAYPHAVAAAVRDVVPNPFRGPVVRPEWRTAAAVGLAEAAADGGRWGHLPVLADALEEAGCNERPVLDHLRGDGPHGPGCWAVDAVLGRG